MSSASAQLASADLAFAERDLAAAVAEVESAQADTRRWRELLTSARLEALEVQKDHTIVLALFLSTQNAIGTLAVQLESRAERLSPGDSGHGVELLEIAKSLRAIVTDRAAISARVLR